MNPETPAGDRPIDRLARDKRLDPLADAVQAIVQRALNGDDPFRKFANSVLHGTFLGHPLHPLVTDIPIGAWTVGAVADLLALGDERYAFAADVATSIGYVGAIAAALSGWAEWSDTKGDPKRLGIAHASLNGAAVLLYGASLTLRATHRRPAATVTALVGYALLGSAGYLGGELSYGLLLGTRHTAEPIDPPTDFTPVAKTSDVPTEGMIRVSLEGMPVLLSRIRGVIHATSAVCTHRGAPLDEGQRTGDCIRCPWHGSLFALDGGGVIEGPATFPLPSFDARIVDESVEIRVVGIS